MDAPGLPAKPPVRLLVLVTGGTMPSVEERRGDFARMFTEGIHDGLSDAVVDVIDCQTKAEDDPLPDVSDYAGVTMTGSPAMVGENTSWMRWGVRAIRRCIDEDVPFLGVCFGHQLLGVALGAAVGPNERGREMGTVDVELTPEPDDPLLGPLPATFTAQVTHVDVILSPGDALKVYGISSHDPHHVVRAGPWTWGVQFHPELDAESIRVYIEARAHLLDEEHGAGGAATRLEAVRPSPVAASLLGRFATVCAERQATAAAEARDA